MKKKNYVLTILSLLFTSVYCWGQQGAEAPTINFDKSDINCYGETNGAIVSFIEGGHPPYTLSWSNGEVGEAIYNLSPGFYSLTVVDAVGSTNSRVTEISEPEKLTIISDVINPTTTLIEDGEIIVEIEGGNPFKSSETPYLFDWSNENILLNQFNIGIGTYTLSVSDRNGCSTQETFVLTAPTPMVDSWVEIEQFHSEHNNIVYPNPSNGIFWLEASKEYQKADIHIFDVLGKSVNFDLVNQGKITEINLQQAGAGIYFVKEIGGSLLQKVVVQN
jgi:hypothetical protein